MDSQKPTWCEGTYSSNNACQEHGGHISAHQLISVWNDTQRSRRVVWMGIGCMGKTSLIPSFVCDKHHIPPATTVSVDINRSGWGRKFLPTIAITAEHDYYVLMNVVTNSDIAYDVSRIEREGIKIPYLNLARHGINLALLLYTAYNLGSDLYQAYSWLTGGAEASNLLQQQG